MTIIRDCFSLRSLIEASVRVFLFPEGHRVPCNSRELDLSGEVTRGENAKAVNASVLLARIFKETAGRAITHLAVGTGPGAYDISDPPEVVTNTRLVGELARTPILFTNYVDGSGDVTLENTNTVDLTFSFGFSEAVGTLVEMGMFGGPGADTTNGGLITNYKVFLPFAKPSDRIMYVVWRLRFNI